MITLHYSLLLLRPDAILELYNSIYTITMYIYIYIYIYILLQFNNFYLNYVLYPICHFSKIYI
jgi:hypothetical protein